MMVWDNQAEYSVIKQSVWIIFFVSFFVVQTPVFAEERGGKLSGDHDKVGAQLDAPDANEPDRGKAGADKNRPTLKLPDIVVRGDRQYRVTAERRDLLLMDPMLGTKEMPADLGKVTVPGLEDDKDAPAADTVTAKSYLFLLEAGIGTSRLGDAKVIAGYEFEHVDMILRADYFSRDHPAVFGIRPFDQGGNMDFELGVRTFSGLKLIAGLRGKAETHRQPEGLAQGWGDWLEQAFGSARINAELEINPRSNILLKTRLGNFYEQGIAPDKRPVVRSRFGEIGAEYEQDIQGLMKEDINLLIKLAIISQEALMESTMQQWRETEYLQHLTAHLRFRPVSTLHLEAGIRMDEFHGVNPKNSSKLVGKASLVLPIGATLYALADGGLQWPLVQEWAFEHPRQALFSLPEAEHVQNDYQVGWRQRFGDLLSTNVAWFRKNSTAFPVWLDGDGDGLFARLELSDGKQEGLMAQMELHYSRTLSQVFRYTYRESDVAGGLLMPNTPRHEGQSELRLTYSELHFTLMYHYLGERYGDPSETQPALGAAHLLGLDADYQLLDYLDVYLKMENMLGYTWEEWKGYSGRTFSFMCGVRIGF
ncbi:TonB-dependent receptor [bacterium]|nr:TonB-dependent receptor [bacterium]